MLKIDLLFQWEHCFHKGNWLYIVINNFGIEKRMLFYAVLCCRHRTADSILLLMMVNKGLSWTHFQQKPVSRKFGKYGINYWTLAKMWQKSLISTAHLDECGLIHRKVTTYCNVSKWIQFGLCIQRSNMGFKYKCFQSELVIKMDRRERKNRK